MILIYFTAGVRRLSNNDLFEKTSGLALIWYDIHFSEQIHSPKFLPMTHLSLVIQCHYTLQKNKPSKSKPLSPL